MDDTNLLMQFKYKKSTPSSLSIEEIKEFQEGMKNTTSNRLQEFVHKFRASINGDQVA